MDECDDFFDRESQMVERLTEEYRRLHIALGALHLGLDMGEASLRHDDAEWGAIELEKLYTHLESLGAEWRVDAIEVGNHAVLNKRKEWRA